jgi:Ca2+-binding RTX toxin-like protein
VSAALAGGPGNDTLTAGYSSIEGGAGNDTLRGGNGANTLSGGEGDDQLRGGVGVDELTGGPGNDTFTTSSSDKVVVGGGSTTTIDASTGSIDGPDGSDTYVSNPTVLAPGDSNEVFIGSSRPDKFISYGGHDRIYGQGGNDTLIAVHAKLIDGGPGADVIEAWFGGTVKGRDGDDTIRTMMETKDLPGVVGEAYDIDAGRHDRPLDRHRPGRHGVGPRRVRPRRLLGAGGHADQEGDLGRRRDDPAGRAGPVGLRRQRPPSGHQREEPPARRRWRRPGRRPRWQRHPRR